MGNKTAKVLKIVIPLLFLIFGLTTIVYPKITGVPLTPVYKYEKLTEYPIWEIPLVYIFSYATRAWGPLLFAFMLGGFFSTFISKERMMAYFSSKTRRNYFIAAGLAPVFTVCSCAMIPIFAGIMMASAGIGPGISFLLMAPAANFMAIIFTSEIISWKLALARIVFSFFGAIIIGMIVAKTPWGRAIEEKYRNMAGRREIAIKEMAIEEKFWETARVAWDLTKKVVPYLVLGLVIVSYIEAYLPKDIVARWLTGIHGVILGGAIGVPTYTPTLVEVFFTKSLINLGMASAAALAFLIGAPMASIPSMLGVSRVVGWKVVLTYAVLAIVVAIISGLIYLGLGVGL
jgi:hypothetical protein